MTWLLEATGLTKHFVSGGVLSRGGRRTVQALHGVDLAVARGETLAVVGESGCGKSTLGRCLLRLHDLTAGRLLFEGRDITTLPERALRPLRPRMQMVFQDPSACLNPRRRIADLMAEPLRVHTRWTEARIGDRLHELMDLVGLDHGFLSRYPHEFSGGQRQRIGIARALALEPSLIVADEPVSALDVSVQAQVINLLVDLQTQLHLTYVFIAHDLGVVRHIASRTAVMYLGTIVEIGPTAALFADPLHWYTDALLSAAPRLDPGQRAQVILAGEMPSPLNPPPGCRFHPRCPRAEPRCTTEIPRLTATNAIHSVACHFPRGSDH